jgi:hypothetical protein
MSSFIKTDTHITIVFDDGNTATVYNTDDKYNQVLTAVKNKDWDLVKILSTPTVELEKQISDTVVKDRVNIEGGIVYFDNKPMHSALTERMIEMLRDGFDITPMTKFLNNLMDNTSYRAVNELYGFLEASNLPITEDGHFLAYKRINKNYRDIYTDTMDNSIGAIVEMHRNEVDEDKHNTCSSGLHFCSREYLSSYGTSEGNRTVIVKINPRDVIAIPADYNLSKGRCCRYEVISELEHSNEDNIEGSYQDTSQYQDDYNEVSDDDYDDVGDVGDVYDKVERDYNNDGINDFVKAVEDFIDDAQPNKEQSPQVVQIHPTTGAVIAKYESALDAQHKNVGFHAGNIRRVLRGERKTADGFKWEYDTTN